MSICKEESGVFRTRVSMKPGNKLEVTKSIQEGNTKELQGVKRSSKEESQRMYVKDKKKIGKV